MTETLCPTCNAPIELDICWRQDSDGDEIHIRTWWYPDLATEVRCLTCGAEPDPDTLGTWLDEIAQAGYPPDPYDTPDHWDVPSTLPY